MILAKSDFFLVAALSAHRVRGASLIGILIVKPLSFLVGGNSSCKAEAAEGSRDDLVVTASGAEEFAEFAVLSVEASGGIMALEAAHASDPAPDAAMVLFEAVVHVGAGAVPDRLAQHAAVRPWVGSMPVRRHPVRPEAHGRPGRAEERLGRLHVSTR